MKKYLSLNKKTILRHLIIIGFTIISILLVISILYHKEESSEVKELNKNKLKALSNYKLLYSIPSNAQSVFYFQSIDKLIRLFPPLSSASQDTTILGGITHSSTSKVAPKLLNRIIAVQDSKFNAFLMGLQQLEQNKKLIKSLLTSQMVVSTNLIGKHSIPIAAIFISKRSEQNHLTLQQLAKENNLYYKLIAEAPLLKSLGMKEEMVLLLSSSQTLIDLSIRHIENKLSILDSHTFLELVAKSEYEEAVLFTHNSSIEKFTRNYLKPEYKKYTQFISKLCSISSLAIQKYTPLNKKHQLVKLSGSLKYDGSNEKGFLCKILERTNGQIENIDFLPSHTIFALSLPINNIDTYIEDLNLYRDFHNQFNKFKFQNKNFLQRYSTEPFVWAKQLDIKEITLAYFNTEYGLSKSVIIRKGNKEKNMGYSGTKAQIEYFPYNDFIPFLFGDLFSIKSDSVYVLEKDNCLIIGEKVIIDDYLKKYLADYSLKKQLKNNKLYTAKKINNCGLFAYLSINEDRETLRQILRNNLLEDKLICDKSSCLDTDSYSSILLYIRNLEDKHKPNMNLTIEWNNITRAKFNVPKFINRAKVGNLYKPFIVTNYTNNHSYIFNQQESNHYLCLKKNNGNGIWTIPFHSPICRRVEQIDYYRNGKIQFAFCSGSKFYILDRLGRFVKPSPLDLQEEILLGPKLYYSNEKKEHLIMVLQKNGELQLFNTKGEKPSDWQGIKTHEAIIDLPELVEVKNNKFWIVKTALQTSIFHFHGGSSLYNKKGDKMIKPNSKIIVNKDKGTISGVRYDGKNAIIKI